MIRAALLLIHPLGASREFWEPAVARLSPHARCVAPDLSGSVAEQVEELEELRVRQGIGKVVPVGCAVGAMVAAAYAARHPAQAVSLVLANPMLRMMPENTAMLRERAAKVRKGGIQAILPDAVDKPFHNMPRDARYAAYLARFALHAPEPYARFVEAVATADVTKDVAEIRCPTLIVTGAHDIQFPPDRARHVHEAIEGSEFHVLPDAAHFVPLQQPEAFSALVLDFLQPR